MKHFFLERIIEIFENGFTNLSSYHNLMQNQKAVLAYSGGKDSSFLLNFFYYLFEKKRIPEPIIFHLNHQIRNNQDEEDHLKYYLIETFPLVTYCKKKNIPNLSKRLKMSLEETGRVIRYHELKKLAIKHNAYIATGHHEIDYLETIFINMIRGTGHKGFQTFPIFNNNIFRPLLKFYYKEIEEANQISKWKIFTDESNEDEQFLRNRIRKNMIPFLLKEGLNPKKLYENFHAEEFSIAHDYPDFKSNSISKIIIDKNLIMRANLSDLKEILDIHLKVFPLHPLNKNFFQSLVKKIKDKKPILLENKEAYFHKKENGNLIIIPKNSSLLKMPRIVRKNNKNFIFWNDRELELEEGFTLGVYQNGLKILQNKMNKSVSEIFREKDIPVLVRKNIPILFQDAIPVKILFEIYEPSIQNLIGDLK